MYVPLENKSIIITTITSLHVQIGVKLQGCDNDGGGAYCFLKIVIVLEFYS